MISRLLLLLLLPVQAAAESVSSPSGDITFSLDVTIEDGIPSYTVQYRDKAVIARSRLGLKVQTGDGLSDGFKLVGTARHSNDEIWEQPWGERRLVREHYNEAVYQLESATGVLVIRVRVFDDGLGFRYEVPDQDGLTVTELDERTQFQLAGSGTAFWQPGDGNEGYEHLFRRTEIDEMYNAHTPATMHLDNGIFLSLHEAALLDYPAYRLRQAESNEFVVDLRQWSDGSHARVSLPFVSPWRTLQISDTAVGLLNSSLILNLNEPNKLGDVSWVQPGKYTGIWWEIHRGLGTWSSGPDHAATTDAVKTKIDFASKYGMSGVLAEGWNVGWDGDYVSKPTQDLTTAAPDFDLPVLAEYAKQKGVRLVGHHETGGQVTHYEKQMDEAFDLMAMHDVRQVKTGYVGKTGTLKRVDAAGETHLEHKDSQFAVRHQLNNIKAAAERKISINTHEPVKDTGLRRTYPNWLSREGSRGQEFNIWGDPGNPPEHEVMLAYTRLLAGPMDFTPGIFDLDFEIRGKDRRVQTTLAKQLALYVTIYSPIQMVPDMPENYLKYRDAFQFIIDVPTDWEQSIALLGEIGDYVVYARQERDGEDWYLGAITNEKPRTIKLPLDFLADGVSYLAFVYRDGDEAHWDTNPYDYAVEIKTLNNKNALELNLAAGGGTAIRFKPIEREQG